MANWRSYIDPSIGDGQNTIDGIIANGSTYGLQISDDLNVTGLSTFSDIARFSSTIRLDGQLRDGDNNFGSSGQVLSSDGTDTRWINAAQLSAGAASQVAVNDDSNTNAERFITLVDSSSGNNNIKTDGSLKYNPSTNTITTVNITGNVTGNLTGNVTGNVTGNASGNSGSATVLQTSRTIGGVSFNGSSNINLPGVNQAGNQNTSGNAATASKLATSRQIGGVSFDGTANINLPGVNQDGNQNTTGNAATATVLETSRNFSISGEITANAQSFNGSGNLTLSATVDNNVIDEANLKISNSPQNGFFLKCNTGVSGGLTWSEVTLPTAATLDGTTLASGITASSITSLGTLTGLTVSGGVTVGGDIDANGGANAISITSSDIGSDGSSNWTGNPGASRLKIQAHSNRWYIVSNSNSNRIVQFRQNGSDKTWIANDGQIYHGSSGTGDKYWRQGNDGSGSGLDADVLDGQHGSYYRNAGNLNAGTIPDARLANSSLFVTGMIMMYTGSTAPSGWAICNGQNGTPDLRDRFIVGAGSAYSVNNTGGANSVTLTESQIPSHNHSFSGSSSHSHTVNNHSHSFSGSGSQSHTHGFTGVGGNDHNQHTRHTTVMRNRSNPTVYTAAGNTGVQSSTVSISISGNTGGSSPGTNSQTVSISGNTGNKGGGSSHENRPPYYALMFIMKL